MRKSLVWALVCITVAVGFISCGGGGDTPPSGDSGGNNIVTLYGQFIDAPVEGLTYSSGTVTGKTDGTGMFKYISGQNVSFKVGDIILGEATGQSLITPLDLVKKARNDVNATADDQMTVNLVRFLLTVSTGTTKLTIDSTTDDNCKGKTLLFDQFIDTFSLPAGITATALVSAATATTHFQTTLDSVLQTTSQTVSDPDTNLIWQKTDDNVKRNWYDAATYCENLDIGIYDDWTLPSREELQGLNSSSIYDQIEGTHYADLGGGQYAGMYWSSTSYDADQAYHVFLGPNNAEGYANKSGWTNLVRCVRENAPATVTDPATNLTWQKEDDNVKRNWYDAGTYCDNAIIGGYDDWRLPSRTELWGLNSSSIYDQIEGTHYAQVNGQYVGMYWSSTSYDADQAYHVFLGPNNAEGYANKTGWTNLVRCVRP